MEVGADVGAPVGGNKQINPTFVLMKYQQSILYLGEDPFEEMVVSICQNILGIGVTSFAKGKDLGKDGKFDGTAISFPSVNNPWSGKMIIQAKHTGNPVASCSDNTFFGNQSSTINEEIKRLKKIKSTEGLDYYLLFTNRKYSGVTDNKIIKEIAEKVGLDERNIFIAGNSSINSFLNKDPHTVRQFDLEKYNIPFDFSDQDIANLIVAMHAEINVQDVDEKSQKIRSDFEKIPIKVKNTKNNLSQQYYENSILTESLSYFAKIDLFLKNPTNEEFKDIYFDIASELRDTILIKRENFAAFEEIFVAVSRKVTSNRPSLRGKKRFVSVLLHYMYYTCSIGIK